MNRYEDALDTVKCKVTTNAFICDSNKRRNLRTCRECDFVKAITDLQELVEKDTPKKAILVHNYDGYVYECPNCHEEFRPNYFANSITWKGCPFCLQALDFSEDTKIL